MAETILCEAQYDAGFPSKVRHYRYADQKKDKRGSIIREKMEIVKGRRYHVAKRVVEGCERNYTNAKKQPEVYGGHAKLLWKRIK